MADQAPRQLTPEEIKAEVAKALAEADKATAEASKALAEARKVEFEATQQEHLAITSAMALEKARRKRDVELADDEYHHVYVFNDTVTSNSVNMCRDTLSTWHRLSPKCDITVVFDSPGGNVIAGMSLFDYLRYLSRQGHQITTICSGMAASMAGILLQAGDVRICGPESYILIHELSASTGGKINEMKDDVEFYNKICQRVINIFVKRSGGKLTKAFMVKNWTRKDWWLSSDEALKLGLVDKVE